MPGDPYKFINWKATARDPGGKVMVNEYEREGGLRTTIILLDVGWWMRYGTAEDNPPLEYGVSLILSLSRYYLGMVIMLVFGQYQPAQGSYPAREPRSTTGYCES